MGGRDDAAGTDDADFAMVFGRNFKTAEFRDVAKLVDHLTSSMVSIPPCRAVIGSR